MNVNRDERAERNPDQARQGEVVFARPWKRKVFFASVAAAAAVAALLLIAFT